MAGGSESFRPPLSFLYVQRVSMCAIDHVGDSVIGFAELHNHPYFHHGAVLSTDPTWDQRQRAEFRAAGSFRGDPPISIALKALSAMHSLGKRISSVQLRVRAPQSSQRSSGFHKPAASGATPETATILASMQQPADFFCKEFLPGRHRLEAPFHFARRAQALAGGHQEIQRSECRQCRCPWWPCASPCREHHFGLQALK
jgi:hypothetical protein